MMNLQLIENQPRWRIWIVARFAQLMGVCIHVEGFPFGSIRTRKERGKAEPAMGKASGQIGSGGFQGGGATGI